MGLIGTKYPIRWAIFSIYPMLFPHDLFCILVTLADPKVVTLYPKVTVTTFTIENEKPVISCGIHIALGVCCPRKNCWPRFINASAAAAKGEEEEGDSPKVKSGSDEDIKDAIVAAAAAAGVSIEDQTETTEM